MADQATSKTPAEVQEPVAGNGGQVAATEASEAKTPGAQEQPPATPETAAPEKPEISEAERQRRKLQGEYDRRLHQERMARERTEQELQTLQQRMQELEERRLAELPDEDLANEYRRRLQTDRQQAQEQARTRQLQQQMRLQEVERIRAYVYGLCPDDKSRQELEQRERAGEFTNPQEFRDAALVYRDQHLERKAQQKYDRELQAMREAETKAAKAEAAEMTAPDLGSGVPVGSEKKYVDNLAQIADGYAEKVARKKKGG